MNKLYLQAKFQEWTGEELMLLFAKLESWGWQQNDLPWIFETYSREELLNEARIYPSAYKHCEMEE